MRYFEKYIEQFYDDGIFSDVRNLQFEETNNYSQIEKNLIYLLWTTEKKTMGEITDYFKIPKSTTNFIVKKLVTLDILEIKINPDDKRVKNVYLSGNGMRTAKKLTENLNQRFEKMMENAINVLQEKMTEDEIKVIKKALNVLFLD